jgi:hypothetical protein
MPVAVLAPGRGIGANSAASPIRLAKAIEPKDNPLEAKKCRRVISKSRGFLNMFMVSLDGSLN